MNSRINSPKKSCFKICLNTVPWTAFSIGLWSNCLKSPMNIKQLYKQCHEHWTIPIYSSYTESDAWKSKVVLEQKLYFWLIMVLPTSFYCRPINNNKLFCTIISYILHVTQQPIISHMKLMLLCTQYYILINLHFSFWANLQTFT